METMKVRFCVRGKDDYEISTGELPKLPKEGTTVAIPTQGVRKVLLVYIPPASSGLDPLIVVP